MLYWLHQFTAYVSLAALLVAAVIVLLLLKQGVWLKQKKMSVAYRFPSQERLEKWLFEAFIFSFVALSITLLTGFHGHPLSFTSASKFTSAIASWVVIALLLIWRLKYGIQGKMALRGVLFSLALILIAFLFTE